MSISAILKSLRQNYLAKNSFYSLLTGKKISDKRYETVLKGWSKFEIITMKD